MYLLLNLYVLWGKGPHSFCLKNVLKKIWLCELQVGPSNSLIIVLQALEFPNIPDMEIFIDDDNNGSDNLGSSRDFSFKY